MIELRFNRAAVFNDTYLPSLEDYSHRFEVYYGGAGSGKSHFIAQKLILKALKSRRKVLIIRKTLVSQKDSCWRLVLEVLQAWHLYERCQIRRTDYELTLPNGSVFLFKGIDDPERIKSIVGITDIWVEEATELTEEDFDQLNLRLRSEAGNLQIFASFNPVSKASWVYQRWFAEDAHPDDTKILQTTYKDNKFLPEEYTEALEKLMQTNPTYYRIYALGEFCSLDKLVYNNWHVEAFADMPEGTPLQGLDFGFVNDPTAFVASVLREQDKRIYVCREWGATNLTNEEIARALAAMGYSKAVITADSAEPKSIEEIRRAGIRRIKESVKGADSIIHGIQKLQQYELIVHPSCTETITELQNYSWQKDRKTGEYINKPVDIFNHYLDALRYSLQCVDDRRVRVFDKGALGL